LFIFDIYALFKDHKRNPLVVMAKAVHTDHQKFQSFFSCLHNQETPTKPAKNTFGTMTLPLPKFMMSNTLAKEVDFAWFIIRIIYIYITL
jgi:hypothetical protein